MKKTFKQIRESLDRPYHWKGSENQYGALYHFTTYTGKKYEVSFDVYSLKSDRNIEYVDCFFTFDRQTATPQPIDLIKLADDYDMQTIATLVWILHDFINNSNTFKDLGIIHFMGDEKRMKTYTAVVFNKIKFHGIETRVENEHGFIYYKSEPKDKLYKVMREFR